jgi:voltage-gated potassium channel Kch
VLGGATLLFVLYTSNARPGAIRLAAIVVGVGMVAAGAALLVGNQQAGKNWAFAIGLLLALGAPLAIGRRILAHTVITIKTVMGALCLYLLVGLFFSYVFALVESLTGGFFVQVADAGTTDFIYFSYVTLATVGYGDLTAASNLGRMLAVAEALTGQLFVSAVALLVNNLGRQPAAGGTTDSEADLPEGPQDDRAEGPTE